MLLFPLPFCFLANCYFLRFQPAWPPLGSCPCCPPGWVRPFTLGFSSFLLCLLPEVIITAYPYWVLTPCPEWCWAVGQKIKEVQDILCPGGAYSFAKRARYSRVAESFFPFPFFLPSFRSLLPSFPPLFLYFFQIRKVFSFLEPFWKQKRVKF